MFKIFTTISLFCLVLKTNAQTVAYPINLERSAWINCLYLNSLNPEVRGHQNNTNVNYFPSFIDATNNTNQLPVFYEMPNSNEVIFARVTPNQNNSFAISEISITVLPIQGLPPPPGIFVYDVCDVNNEGTVTVNLMNLVRSDANNNLDICGSKNSEIEITFHLTEADANANINAINSMYNFTEEFIKIFFRIQNTNSNANVVNEFRLILVDCEGKDTDKDTINDFDEDVNNNLFITDEDTDQDGLKNYEDDDDDGDGILTKNEDYNGNGDPRDDDTNANGVPDYLDASVALTLSNTVISKDNFTLHPNPFQNHLTITSSTAIQSFEIYTILGQKIILKPILQTKNVIQLPTNTLQEGTYFLKLIYNTSSHFKKIIKKF